MSKKANSFSAQVRELARQMVLYHQDEYPALWATIGYVESKIGCVPQAHNDWGRPHEVDEGMRDGIGDAKLPANARLTGNLSSLVGSGVESHDNALA